MVGDYQFVALVDVQGVAVDQIEVRILGEQAHRLPDGTRRQQVVGVDPGEDVAGGPVQSLVDGVGRSPVALGHPVAQPGRVAPQHVHTPVARPAVHDDRFQARVVLAEDAVQRLTQEHRLVERGRDDAHRRQVRVRGRERVPGCREAGPQHGNVGPVLGVALGVETVGGSRTGRPNSAWKCDHAAP